METQGRLLRDKLTRPVVFELRLPPSESKDYRFVGVYGSDIVLGIADALEDCARGLRELEAAKRKVWAAEGRPNKFTQTTQPAA